MFEDLDVINPETGKYYQVEVTYVWDIIYGPILSSTGRGNLCVGYNNYRVVLSLNTVLVFTL